MLCYGSNDNINEINNYLVSQFGGKERIYYIFYETKDDGNNFFPMEFLNSLTFSGLPHLPHYYFRLKVGTRAHIVDSSILMSYF